MAEVDTSSYNLLNRNPSAIDQAAGFAGLMQGINANKLFRAQQAAGRAAQQSITPEGNVDPQNMMLRASQDTTAAVAMPDVIAAGQTQQLQDVAKKSAELKLHLDHLANMRSMIGPLLAQAGPGADPAKVRQSILKTIVTLAGNKSLTPQEAATQAADVPNDLPGQQEWLTRHMAQNLQATDQISTMLGTMGRVDVVGPGGETTSTPVVTPAILNPAAGEIGKVQTRQPIGTPEALAASAQEFSTLREDQAEAPTRVTTLTKAFDALEKVNPGPLTGDWNKIQKTLINVPFIGEIIDKEKIASFDELEKFLAQNISAAPMAQGTDAKLLQATVANPHIENSKDAMHFLLAGNMALERMKMAQMKIFQDTGAQPNEFANWRLDFNRGIDPRAFAYDLYTPAERKDMLSKMTAEGKQKFLATINTAIKAGVLDKSTFGK